MPRRSNGPPRRYGGPWYGRFTERLEFEREARSTFHITTRFGSGSGYTLSLTVDVPHYEPRRLRIVFDRNHTDVPRVFADGPTRSKHRYKDESLCMWYPRDPKKLRWVRSDGLIALIGHAIAHLFREAWWRETGEWPGPEAPHVVEAGKKEVKRA